MPLAIIAVGGNALLRADDAGTVGEQFIHARALCAQLVPWVDEGWGLVLTHGNGPQVGNMLWRVELAAQQVHPVDLGICDANSQGQIGYMLQQVLGNELQKHGIDTDVVTLVTQVEVDPSDPWISNPTKPIGPFFSQPDAETKQTDHGWIMTEIPGSGWRRLVPSPAPQRILEIGSVRQVVRSGGIPIACGGGGIPVVRDPDGGYHGIEAVIDKDRTTSLLARRLAADVMVICTAVPNVSLDFGTDRERKLRRATVAELTAHAEDGQFPVGSMGPKVQACVDFVTGGGVGTNRRAIITDTHSLGAAMSGEAGTVVLP